MMKISTDCENEYAGPQVRRGHLLLLSATMLSCLVALVPPLRAQGAATNDPVQYGPYNASLLTGGKGLRVPIANVLDSALRPDAPWTLSCWVKADGAVEGTELVAGIGDVTAEYPRFLALEPGKAVLWQGAGNEISGPMRLKPAEWRLLTATFDGHEFRLFVDGTLAAASSSLVLGTPTAVLQIAPPVLAEPQKVHFGGLVASFVLLRRAVTDTEVKQLAAAPPDFALLTYEDGSKPWPIQTRQQTGYRAPQDPAQMPHSREAFSKPVAIKRPNAPEAPTESAPGEWTLSDAWTLREAPKVEGDGVQLSTLGYTERGWMRATVPGTVLTTMVDDGIYPDPDYGLNNLAIPETLNKQDYWYRNVFSIPAAMRDSLHADSNVDLTFQGINYEAEVWLNGTRLGTIKGAFRRGNFDVTRLLRAGEKNVIAVRISPPPHPGIPQEQSIAGGPGENGGVMELDGPTFLATEGWDWIPAIRDRDSGIWQPVTLTVRREVKLGDVQVLPTFKHHDMTRADVEIDVPVTNLMDHAVDATIDASFDGVSVHKVTRLSSGDNLVRLLPSEFSQLTVLQPRLWWPNGYGRPELYTLKLAAHVGTELSDSRQTRFGMREVSYELSLLDAKGDLRRVEFTPAISRQTTHPIVDVSHNGMREIPGADAIALNVAEEHRDDYAYRSVVSSLARGAENNPAIEPSNDMGPAPYLVLKVNNVRIAARGGNWGMDDARKRVSRQHLEPFFRLDRDANMNIIRNWVGQSTEEVFYDLADEYGMMVWNDFWESTQNYNVEAEDPALFLDNAADTISHFRNHPSIVLWCGRNEGVPQPILNEGLERLVRTLDGTRFYSPSSNQINLQQSGPYSYQNPSMYYTTLNRGFSVETGTPSMSTLESFESTTPKADQWPMDDVWAYHDWHASGNGDTHSFMREMEAEFGAATSLPDFERKAQMLNYVDHRAIFEGMTANLWAPNSGRMLWMTQPAWPSTHWQLLSSDYDTQASFYGAMKGAEPVHVQLNLASYQVDIVNTTPLPLHASTVSATVYSLTNTVLAHVKEQRNVDADGMVHSFTLPLGPILSQGLALIKLELADSTGKELSRNLYWLGKDSAAYRELGSLPTQTISLTATGASTGEETTLAVVMKNTGSTVALENKLTLVGADNQRILPAYYSDNYVSLLPGESETISIHFPTQKGRHQVQLALRGWNVDPQTVAVSLP